VPLPLPAEPGSTNPGSIICDFVQPRLKLFCLGREALKSQGQHILNIIPYRIVNSTNGDGCIAYALS